MVYSNGIYYLYEYEFSDPEIYNSLVLLNHKKYSIEDTEIDLSDILQIAENIKHFVSEPKIPFPQADSFKRIIHLCELLGIQNLAKDEITEKYAFDARQSNYYTGAAQYLGLIEKIEHNHASTEYCLSKLGKKIMNYKYKARRLELCKCILRHELFHEVFSQSCQNGIVPDKHTIVQTMMRHKLYNVGSINTFERRAPTVSG